MPRKAGNLRERFIVEYLIDQNATQAAIRAGYSPKTARSQGQRLLTHADISGRIREKLQKQLKRIELTADYVIDSLKEVAERCKQAEAVLDKKGEPIGEYRFDSTGANKALELLGKHLKLFTEKHEVTIIDDREIAEAALQPLLDAGHSRAEAVELVKPFVPEVAKLASELVQ